MSPYALLAVTQLCAAVRSPRDLADAYRVQAALNWLVIDAYVELTGAYDPFANEVAVIEEFAGSYATVEPYLVSDALDARSLWMAEESVRLAVESDDLLRAADEVPRRYRGLRALNVRALRRECLDVLLPSP